MQEQLQAGPEALHNPQKRRQCFMAQPSQPHKKQDQRELLQESFSTKAAGEHLRQRKTVSGRSVPPIAGKLLLCEWVKPGWLEASLTCGAPGMLLGSRQA